MPSPGIGDDRWRQRSDDPSDAALEALEQTAAVKANEDILQRLRSEKSSSTDVAKFWEDITSRPPPGAGALSQQWYDERRGRHVSLDEELCAEREVLQRGQAMFYRYYAGILVSAVTVSDPSHITDDRVHCRLPYSTSRSREALLALVSSEY